MIGPVRLVWLALPGLLGLARAAPPRDAEPTPPPPYVLPWALRPVIAPSVLRWDTTLALYEDPETAARGVTLVSGLLGVYKVPGTGGPSAGLNVLARLTLAHDQPPAGPRGTLLANPLVGAAYAFRFRHELRLNAALLLALPLGTGGGDEPPPEVAAVRPKAQLARAAMENSLYATNDLVPAPGIGFGYVRYGLVVQAEATLLFLIRVRGEAAQQEAFKLNLATGLFVAYFVVPRHLSLGLELRYQRWLVPPAAAEADPALLDNLSLAGGPRFHVPLGGSAWLRCGLSYGGGLDDPLHGRRYGLLQIDCPVTF